MTKKRASFIQQLHQSRSTPKTQLIAIWPEVQLALAAGFTKKAVHEQLVREKRLVMSYPRFAHHTARLLEQSEQTDQQQTTASATEKKAAAKPAKARAKRFDFNPKAEKDKLI